MQIQKPWYKSTTFILALACVLQPLIVFVAAKTGMSEPMIKEIIDAIANSMLGVGLYMGKEAWVKTSYMKNMAPAIAASVAAPVVEAEKKS